MRNLSDMSIVRNRKTTGETHCEFALESFVLGPKK